MKKSYTLLLLLSMLLLTACRSKQNMTKPDKKTYTAAQAKLGIEADRHDDARLLTECASWLGVPYSYGGNTKRGVDCSGFTCAVFQNVYGKKLHRRSRDQYHKDVTHKKKSSLRQGDLVFFTSPNSGFLARKSTAVCRPILSSFIILFSLILIYFLFKKLRSYGGNL